MYAFINILNFQCFLTYQIVHWVLVDKDKHNTSKMLLFSASSHSLKYMQFIFYIIKASKSQVYLLILFYCSCFVNDVWFYIFFLAGQIREWKRRGERKLINLAEKYPIGRGMMEEITRQIACVHTLCLLSIHWRCIWVLNSNGVFLFKICISF